MSLANIPAQRTEGEEPEREPATRGFEDPSISEATRLDGWARSTQIMDGRPAYLSQMPYVEPRLEITSRVPILTMIHSRNVFRKLRRRKPFVLASQCRGIYRSPPCSSHNSPAPDERRNHQMTSILALPCQKRFRVSLQVTNTEGCRASHQKTVCLPEPAPHAFADTSGILLHDINHRVWHIAIVHCRLGYEFAMHVWW